MWSWLAKERCWFHPLLELTAWSLRTKNRTEFFLKCPKCDYRRRLYAGIMRYVFVMVKRNDLDDQIFHIPWCMGRIPHLDDWYEGTYAFALIPFSYVLEMIVRAYKAMRYLRPDKVQADLRFEYRRGMIDGRRQLKSQIIQMAAGNGVKEVALEYIQNINHQL